MGGPGRARAPPPARRHLPPAASTGRPRARAEQAPWTTAGLAQLWGLQGGAEAAVARRAAPCSRRSRLPRLPRRSPKWCPASRPSPRQQTAGQLAARSAAARAATGRIRSLLLRRRHQGLSTALLRGRGRRRAMQPLHGMTAVSSRRHRLWAQVPGRRRGRPCRCHQAGSTMKVSHSTCRMAGTPTRLRRRC